MRPYLGFRPPKPIDLGARFRGIAFVMRLDATGQKRRAMLELENGTVVATASYLSLRRAHNFDPGPDFLPPRAIRASWRTGNAKLDSHSGAWVGGKLLGDHTILVAERIPDSIIDHIRKNGGALRLKFRLKDDNVLLGWDVEERFSTPYGRAVHYILAGGDFREAIIFDGKVVHPGWQK